MPGSWRPGRRIVMSRGWAEKRVCRSSSGLCSGRFSIRFGPDLKARIWSPIPTCSADWHLSLQKANIRPFDFVVVDEAQDISVAQLRFLAALGGGRPNSLFFAGDLGQRIFQQPFSWKALGVDIRGRSRTLRINYRTSHQIRMQADRLLGPELSDVDGNTEDTAGHDFGIQRADSRPS